MIIAAFSITATSAGIVVVCAAIAALGRGALQLYRWCRRMEQILVYVDSEMRRNGGSTTRDAIWRIEETVNDIDERVQALEEAA